VEVKIVEVPEIPEFKMPEGADPLASIGKTMMGLAQQMQPGPVIIPSPYALPTGLDFRKSASITASSFATLAKIVEQFEQLTREIELERVG
jgi:hypothetical protein